MKVKIGYLTSKILGLAALAIFLSCPASAQVETIHLWEHGAPGAIDNASYRPETTLVDGKIPRIYKVTDPTLAYYPAHGGGTATPAIVVCPGGGYARLAIDHEGWDVAEWLSRQGIAAFILTYRLPSDQIMKEKRVGPLQDVQEAIRVVRRHAAEWRIDPNKIGVMGFSAGGHLAATASTLYDEKVYPVPDTTSARPDFTVLGYPVISMESGITHSGSRDNLLGPHPTPEEARNFSADERVDRKTPPAFIVHAADDQTVPLENSINYMQALRRAGVPCELHIYQSGGHGFGLGEGRGTTSAWPDALKLWLQTRGIL